MLISTAILAINLHQLVLSLCYALLHSLWLGVVAAALAGLVIACTTRSNPAVRYYMLLSIVGLFVLTSVGCFFKSYSQPSELEQVSTTISHLEGGTFSYSADTPSVATVTTWQKLKHTIDAYAEIIVLCWLVIFIWKAGRLVVGMRGLQQCRVQSTQTPGEEWVACVQQLAIQLKVRKVVQVLESALVKVPCTIGYFKPVILVPLGMFTQLPPAQVESILLHELAHIKRNDFAINILLEGIASIFFFNPAIHWLLSVIRQEREVCCDAIVTAYNGQPRPYMEALVSFQEQFSEVAYTMPLTSRHSLLLDRIKRMINKKNKNLTSMEKVILSVSIVAVVSFSFLPAGSVKKAVEQSAKGLPTIGTIASAPFKTSAVVFNKKAAANIDFDNNVQAIADTIGKPDKKDSITGVNRYTSASPAKETEFTEITVASGNRYKIAKEKGVIVLFSVNGQERDVKEADRFKGMIKDIDEKTALAQKDRQKMEQEHLQAEQRRKEIEARVVALENERHIMEQNRTGAQRKREQDEINAGQLKLEWEQKKIEGEQKKIESKHRKLEIEQRRLEVEHKRQMSLSKREHGLHIHDSLASIQKQKVRDIIQLLVQKGVVKNAESVQSFALTQDALVVNGERQDAALHQQLAKTYGVQSDLGLYYGDVKGQAKGYFFGKHEINLAR